MCNAIARFPNIEISQRKKKHLFNAWARNPLKKSWFWITNKPEKKYSCAKIYCYATSEEMTSTLLGDHMCSLAMSDGGGGSDETREKKNTQKLVSRAILFFSWSSYERLLILSYIHFIYIIIVTHKTESTHYQCIKYSNNNKHHIIYMHIYVYVYSEWLCDVRTHVNVCVCISMLYIYLLIHYHDQHSVESARHGSFVHS